MTDVRELIERGRYTAEHGVFDAVDACKYATVAELTDALTAALEREEALQASVERAKEFAAALITDLSRANEIIAEKEAEIARLEEEIDALWAALKEPS